ncbi:MAG TPA: GAF domain-containing sensor histidine kinase [Anaerolineales bacterium]|nr:GAF domain-containing sensor histidine kinase [Anaerolineales bacterium]
MLANETRNPTDNLVLPFKWLALIGLTLLIGWGNAVSSTSVTIVSVAAIWTLFLTLLSIGNKRLVFHAYVSLGLDLVFALLMTGYLSTSGEPFLWAGILPILTGAAYFGLQGGVFTALAAIFLEGIILTVQLGNAEALAALKTPAIWQGGAGVVLGTIAQLGLFVHLRKQSLAQTELEQSQRVERDRIKALYQVTSTMTATLNYQKVLDMALDMTSNVLAEQGKNNTLVSAVLLFSDDELVVGSARRLTPSDHKVSLPAEEGLIVECLRAGQPRKLSHPENDPELNRLIAMRNCKEAFCYPLRTHQDLFGALIFAHPEEGFFTDQRMEILEIVGRQSLVALQNAELYRDLEQEKERMMEIQEEARKQLARDLHDGPTQSVAAIAMRVNFARRLIDRNVQAAGEELYKIEDLARRTTKEIRHMLFTLRPLVLETGGLVAAFQSMAEKMLETYKQKVIVEADPSIVDELEMSKQGVAFYIAEEAVNNARKHAEADQVWIRLKKVHPDVVLLEIEDNGVGFNVGEVDMGYDKRGSLGMVNMRERTELVNGLFHLASEVGKGTYIRVLIPVTDDAAERLKRGKL